MSDHIKRITVETEADIPADVVKDVLETVMVKLGSCWSELTKGPVHDETGKHVANVSVRKVPIDLQMARDVAELDDAVVVQARDAILDNLRDRRLLKWLFKEDADVNNGPIGYVDGPIDLDVQNEIAETLARIAIRTDLASRPVESRSAEPASNPCKLPAEPAGEEPVDDDLGAERYVRDFIIHGEVSTRRLEPWEQAYQDAGHIDMAERRGYIHVGRDVACTITVTDHGRCIAALLNHPATPTNPERLVDWRGHCEWLLDLDEIHVGEDETDVLERIASIRAALSAAPLKEGEGE